MKRDIQEIRGLLKNIKAGMRGRAELDYTNDIKLFIDQQEANLLEAYKAIVGYNTYIEDGDKWCDVCNGVSDKFANSGIVHDKDCIVLKAEQYIGEIR